MIGLSEQFVRVVMVEIAMSVTHSIDHSIVLASIDPEATTRNGRVRLFFGAFCPLGLG